MTRVVCSVKGCGNPVRTERAKYCQDCADERTKQSRSRSARAERAGRSVRYPVCCQQWQAIRQLVKDHTDPGNPEHSYLRRYVRSKRCPQCQQWAAFKRAAVPALTDLAMELIAEVGMRVYDGKDLDNVAVLENRYKADDDAGKMSA